MSVKQEELILALFKETKEKVHNIPITTKQIPENFTCIDCKKSHHDVITIVDPVLKALAGITEEINICIECEQERVKEANEIEKQNRPQEIIEEKTLQCVDCNTKASDVKPRNKYNFEKGVRLAYDEDEEPELCDLCHQLRLRGW